MKGSDSKLKQRLKKIKESFKLLFSSKKKSAKHSRYKSYLESFDLTNEEYAVALKVAELCDEGYSIAAMRFNSIFRQNEIMTRLKDLRKIDELDDEELEEVKLLISKLDNIERERVFVQGELQDTESSLYFYEKYEGSMDEILKGIEEAEEKQAIIERDMGYISDEKEELENEMVSLEYGLVFIYKLTIVSVVIFAIAAFVLAIMNFYFNMEVFLYAAIAVVIAIFFGTIVYISRRQMKYELQKNALLQARAIELLNGKKLQYVHYTNFLNYEYSKFKASSAKQFKKNWEAYLIYKRTSDRYKIVRNAKYEADDALRNFLIKRGIRDTKNTVESLGLIHKIDSTKKNIRRLETELAKLESDIAVTDASQSDIWNKLSVLKDYDDTEGKVIGNLIDIYLKDIEKLYTGVV